MESSEIQIKPIVNYGGKYSISSDGVVYSKNGNILNPTISNSGYLRVNLSIKFRVYKTFFVHRLVAMHFKENPENKKYVNHKDGNKLNNHVDNLEWVTAAENMQHHIKNNPEWHQKLIKRAWNNRFKTLKQYKNGTQNQF